MRNTHDRAFPNQTRQAIKDVFSMLDHGVLGDVYCEEGGVAFGRAHQKKCQTMGIRIAKALKRRLSRKGRK